MKKHVCPWWVGYFLANPLRKLYHDPDKILSQFVEPGMSVLEIGPGMGFFTLPMAKMVGPSGRIVCVDIQEKMLKVLHKRAKKAGTDQHIQLRISSSNDFMISDFVASMDFILLFAVVHEVQNQTALWKEVVSALKKNGKILFAEPMTHIEKGAFEKSIQQAQNFGLQILDYPIIRGSLAASLQFHKTIY
ncbi:MAG: class I SAM-dependent methyltransferase [Oligoflexia bacterium]|nr:class I SAM-dependent methyltransferase [Oligoflexia bacterium]